MFQCVFSIKLMDDRHLCVNNFTETVKHGRFGIRYSFKLLRNLGFTTVVCTKITLQTLIPHP